MGLTLPHTDRYDRNGVKLSPANCRVVFLGERDGFTCHYCSVPITDPRDPEACGGVWEPPITYTHHCGCGKHTPPEPCTYPGGWWLPAGWEWGQNDHVVPRSRGGSDDSSNLVLSCGDCNARKGIRPYADFIARLAAR